MGGCLITGATGNLGSFFLEKFSKDYQVIAGYIENPEVIREDFRKTVIDLSDESLMRKNIEEVMPDCIIHCAAVKDVSFCESNPKQAWEVNVEGTRKIAKICKDLGARLIYLSSDYIFEGISGWYKEDDESNPKTYYGKTKLEGEKVIQEILVNYTICRTGGVYGYKDDFIDFVVNTIISGKELKAFSNIFNTPTYLPNLADNILKIFKNRLNGVFHLVGNERVSRFDFAKKIAEKFEMDANLIIPVEYDSRRENFRRPIDCSLSSQYTQEKIGTKFLRIDEALDEIKKERLWAKKKERLWAK
ncbi:MAG: SDR family oxidoreductase [bacterium]